MGDIYSVVLEAADLVGRIMDGEGVLTEDDEKLMEGVLKESGESVDFLRAYFARAVSEEKHWKSEIDRFSRQVHAKINRAQSQQAWSKMRALELLQARDALGKGTKIKNVAHIKVSQSLNGPEDIADWPDVYLTRKEVIKPNRTQALKDLKAGKEIDGFSIREGRTVVFK